MGFNFRLTETHMNVAKEYALLSRATRNKVGAILVDENNERILMCGYNGTPPNFDNNCEELINGELVTKKEVLHAEANLILFCAKHGISTKNKILYSTLAPCFECAKLIYSCGIQQVIYDEIYRCKDGVDFLLKVGVLVKHYKELKDNK